MSDKEKSPMSFKGTPECWKDDQRMDSLFAPVRNKASNPVDWESKMKFWSSLIESWSLELNDPVVTVKKMEKVFQRKNKTPKCLCPVIENHFKNGGLTTREVLNSSSEALSLSSMTKYVTSTVWSLLPYLSNLSTQNTESAELEYIVVAFLKARGDELMTITQSKGRLIFSLEEILEMLKESGKPQMEKETVLLILQYLQAEKKVALKEHNGKSIVKIAHKDKTVLAVNGTDLAIWKLEQNSQSLLHSLVVLEKEKQKIVEETRDFLRKGLRQAAKSRLRRKKEMEKVMEKRSAALDNIEALLSQVHQAVTDAEIFEAYKIGSEILKRICQQSGMTEDNVLSTVTELQDVLEAQDEIQKALQSPADDTSADEIEEELAKLLATDLPDVASSVLDDGVKKEQEKKEEKRTALLA